MYCLEPIHYTKPPRNWFCADHDVKYGLSPPKSEETLIPSNVHLLPEDSVSLDFFPYSLLPNQIEKVSRKKTPSELLDALKVSALLYLKTVNFNKKI